jgi:hypothetical protein
MRPSESLLQRFLPVLRKPSSSISHTKHPDKPLVKAFIAAELWVEACAHLLADGVGNDVGVSMLG